MIKAYIEISFEQGTLIDTIKNQITKIFNDMKYDILYLTKYNKLFSYCCLFSCKQLVPICVLVLYIDNRDTINEMMLIVSKHLHNVKVNLY